MINAVRISPEDNVVVAIEHIKAGEKVTFKDSDNEIKDIKALDDIRIFHKIALHDIKKEEFINKYGEHIGVASKDVIKGQHVHSHNVEERRENLQEKE